MPSSARTRCPAPSEPRPHSLLLSLELCLLSLFAPSEAAAAPSPDTARPSPSLYTNQIIPAGPWSIHVVRVPLVNNTFRIDSVHAGGGALGLTPLSSQVQSLPQTAGSPVAAINGDFYQRFKAYAGDPRGLQIAHGELLSAPSATPAFWIDSSGRPHTAIVTPQFEISWPGGLKTPFVLNAQRPTNAVALYTPALGPSTHTTGGREFLLEAIPGQFWLPLRIGLSTFARIRAIRDAGDTPLNPDGMILSVPPALTRTLPPLPVGAVIEISTASSPDLRGATAAIGGGPILLRNNRRQKFSMPDDEAYEFSSMLERHPRAALAWNRDTLFLVEVDGRQKETSVGMTLDELARHLLDLGCADAMNLDGGGSATLWFDGAVRNRPCDGRERPIANGIVVLRNEPGTKPALPSTAPPAH